MEIINTIKEIDTELFLYLNGLHSQTMDTVMYWVSHKLFWIPLYAYFLFLAYKVVGKKVWLVMLASALLILLSDQLSVQAFKNVFLRYRPCHNLLIEAKVHLINGHCGGQYGFVSSHATNTFALAMYLFLLLKTHYRLFGVFIFSWASLVAYSRIYCGVHYPADVACGALLGMTIGLLVYKGYNFLHQKTA